MIKVKALRNFSSIQAGNFEAGKVKDCPDWLAKQLEKSGHVEILRPRQTKVIPNDFTQGRAENGSLSPAAPVSREPTASASKRGRPKKNKTEE